MPKKQTLSQKRRAKKITRVKGLSKYALKNQKPDPVKTTEITEPIRGEKS